MVMLSSFSRAETRRRWAFRSGCIILLLRFTVPAASPVTQPEHSPASIVQNGIQKRPPIIWYQVIGADYPSKPYFPNIIAI